MEDLELPGDLPIPPELEGVTFERLSSALLPPSTIEEIDREHFPNPERGTSSGNEDSNVEPMDTDPSPTTEPQPTTDTSSKSLKDTLSYRILCRARKTNRVFEQAGDDVMKSHRRKFEEEKFLTIELLRHYLDLFQWECSKFRPFGTERFDIDLQQLKDYWKESIPDPEMLNHSSELVSKLTRLCYALGAYLFNFSTKAYGNVMLYRLSSSLPELKPQRPASSNTMSFEVGGNPATSVVMERDLENIVVMAARQFSRV